MSDELKRAVAYRGTVTINDTTSYTSKKFTAIYFAEDTVVASMKVNGAVADVKADYITTAATVVKAGTLKTVFPSDHYFSEIELASGSIEIILAEG